MRLIITNLPKNYTDEELARLLEPHGYVRSARIVRNFENGKSRGFAFAEITGGPNLLEDLQQKTLHGELLIISEEYKRQPYFSGPKRKYESRQNRTQID